MATQGIYCHETGEYWSNMRCAAKDLDIHSTALYFYFKGQSQSCLEGLTLIKVDDIFCKHCGTKLIDKNRPKSKTARRWKVCRECSNVHAKNWHRKSRASLKYDFGITKEEYNMMLKKQNGRCAICGNAETVKFNGKVKNLSVDHNHLTGEIRGLLCHKCNCGIGQFNVDKLSIELLEQAIKYVDKY